MDKILYFFAAVYQSIKNRRPGGTPYFNLCMGITAILLLNTFSFLIILKTWFHVNLISDSKNTFIVWFLALAISIFFLIRIIMPLDNISDIEVPQKDVKKMGLIIISFYMLSVVVMMLLIFLTRT